MPRAKKPTEQVTEGEATPVMAEAVPAVEAPKAPEVKVERPAPVQVLPRIERRNAQGSAVSGRYPRIKGGQCEFCGVLNPNIPGHLQYTLCPHFRNLGVMRCSYCPETANPEDVIAKSTLIVASHPNDPMSLVVCCNSRECSRKHMERFKTSL